jgi:hypothetical protein
LVSHLEFKMFILNKAGMLYHLVSHYTCNGCVVSYGEQAKAGWQELRNIHVVLNEDQEIDLLFPHTNHNKHLVWELHYTIWAIKTGKGWRSTLL